MGPRLGLIAISGLFEVQVTVQTAFPGTPLYDRLARFREARRRAGRSTD